MFKYRRCRIWRSSREKMPEGSLESAYSCDWPEVLCQRLVFRRCTRSVVCCQKGDACLFGHTLLTHQCIAMCHSRVWSESFCFAFLSLPGLGLTKRHRICQSLLGSCGGWLFEEAIKLLWMQDQLNFLSHSHSQHQNSAKKTSAWTSCWFQISLDHESKEQTRQQSQPKSPMRFHRTEHNKTKERVQKLTYEVKVWLVVQSLLYSLWWYVYGTRKHFWPILTNNTWKQTFIIASQVSD